MKTLRIHRMVSMMLNNFETTIERYKPIVAARDRRGLAFHPHPVLRDEFSLRGPPDEARSQDVSSDTITTGSAARTANLPEDFVPEVQESPIFQRTEPSRKERRDVQALEEEIPMPRFFTGSQESATLRGKTYSLAEAIAFIKVGALHCIPDHRTLGCVVTSLFWATGKRESQV